MSDQAHGENSESVHCTQVIEETVFHNTNSSTSKISHNFVGLINSRNIFEKCEESNDHNQSVKSTTSDQSLLQSSAGENDGAKSMISIQLNPVGSLQELCMVRRYPFPSYTFSDENLKKPGERFTAKCSLSTYNSSGSGVTKQVAKKEAAYVMYKQIVKLTAKDFHHITNNACEDNDDTCKNTFCLCHESLTVLKTFFDSKDAPKTPHSENIKKNSNGFELMTATDTLKTISEKEGFTYKCVMIPLNCDEKEVLIQVNTNPVIVISKSGKNISDVQESAALAVLQFFKLKHNI